MTTEHGSLRIQLQSMIYLLSLVILVTSLIDLFINRLLFRSGPDVLAHINLWNASDLALVGRISITLEQLVLFVVIGFAAVLLLAEERRAHRLLGTLLILLAACSAVLYTSPLGELAWAVSTLLILVTAITVFGLVWLRASECKRMPRTQRITLQGFLILLALSFLLPLYYRVYLLTGAVGLALPFGIESYQAGIYSVMGTTLAAFSYALAARSPGFTLNYRNFAKAAVVPTLLVAPMLYELTRSFFLTQIFAMVLVMSTDFALSLDLVRTLVFLSWFFLTAILILLIKGHCSHNKMLLQEGIGLILILSTTFLFNYPYYLMLGTIGVLLLSYPLYGTNTDQSP